MVAGEGEGEGEGEGDDGGDCCGCCCGDCSAAAAATSTDRPELEPELEEPVTTIIGLRNATMTSLLCSLRPTTTPPLSGSTSRPGSSTNLTMGEPSGVKPRNRAAISDSSFSLSSARRVCLCSVGSGTLCVSLRY